MIYENTVLAIFVQRNKRFTAEVMVGDEQNTVHIKNIGRLEELLIPKAKVTLQKLEDPERQNGENVKDTIKAVFGIELIDL